jgi:hypothetical protein
MATTPNLGLPLVEQSQSQKEVTINEALTILDAVFRGGIIDKDLATPPGSPSAGDRYIVASSPTGAWTSKAGQIAYYFNGGWRFIVPGEGLFVWLNDEDIMYVYNGSAWTSAVGTGNMLGINTTADATNRLAVRSNAALMTAIYAADSGNGDFQFKINKEASGDSAAFLFQTNFSGRAEFGTLGDDNFTLKVSSDGSTWYDVLKMIASTGRVAFKSIGTGISAAGSDQAGATALTKTQNEVTTVGASQGVRLPSAEGGEWILVANQGANTLNVYPASGHSINALATNAALSIPTDTRRLFFAATSTKWYSL